MTCRLIRIDSHQLEAFCQAAVDAIQLRSADVAHDSNEVSQIWRLASAWGEMALSPAPQAFAHHPFGQHVVMVHIAFDAPIWQGRHATSACHQRSTATVNSALRGGREMPAGVGTHESGHRALRNRVGDVVSPQGSLGFSRRLLRKRCSLGSTARISNRNRGARHWRVAAMMRAT